MYTLLDFIKHKCRDSYVLYIPTVHAFGLVLLTHSFGTDTHTFSCQTSAISLPFIPIPWENDNSF